MSFISRITRTAIQRNTHYSTAILSASDNKKPTRLNAMLAEKFMLDYVDKNIPNAGEVHYVKEHYHIPVKVKPLEESATLVTSGIISCNVIIACVKDSSGMISAHLGHSSNPGIVANAAKSFVDNLHLDNITDSALIIMAPGRYTNYFEEVSDGIYVRTQPSKQSGRLLNFHKFEPIYPYFSEIHAEPYYYSFIPEIITCKAICLNNLSYG